MIVPRFPGSCTPSRAKTSWPSICLLKILEYSFECFSSSLDILNTPNTGCGCWRKDTFLISSKSSNIVSATNPSCSRSLTTLSPSATNNPAFSLPFLVSRDRISLILFFDNTSQIYKKLSSHSLLLLNFLLPLHKISCVRQIESKLSLPSLALFLHKISCVRQIESKLSLPSLALFLHKISCVRQIESELSLPSLALFLHKISCVRQIESELSLLSLICVLLLK